MIDRVHLFKLRDVHADAPTRERLADAARASLAPHGWEVRVGLPADFDAAKAWDLLVEITFAGPADAEHPDTATALDRAFADLRDRSEVEKHWSFRRRV